MNDLELLQALREKRSDEAFAELIRRYAGLVFAIAKRRSGSGSAAEDITQLVFIRFAQNLPRMRTSGELAAWLHRTTLNASIDAWRAESRRRERELQAALMEPNTPNDASWEEIAPHLDEALNELGDEDRQSLLLRFFGRKSMSQVGAALGVSEAAAKMRVGRALDRLRERLNARHAACGAVALAALLIARSTEAAPTQLIARITAIKLLPVAGVTVQFLPKLTGVKAIAATVAVLVGVLIFLHIDHAKEAATRSIAPQISHHTPRFAQTTAHQKQMSFGETNSILTRLRVSDFDTSRPLAGTRIHAVFFLPGVGIKEYDTETDEDGVAEITQVMPSDQYHSWAAYVTAEGHKPKLVSLGHNESVAREYKVKLFSAGTVSGWVVDEQNLPVADVKLELFPHALTPSEGDYRMAFATSRTDGSWTFSYLPHIYQNTFDMTMTKPGYAETTVKIPVNEASSNEVILVINRGFTINGVVHDLNGSPVKNARVNVFIPILHPDNSIETDSAGKFQITGINGMTDVVSNAAFLIRDPQTNASGSLTIHAPSPIVPLYAKVVVTKQGFAGQIRAVPLSNITNTTDFILLPGNIVRGEVVDEAGNRIAKAGIGTTFIEGDGSLTNKPFTWFSQTDASGHFEWDSAPTNEISYDFGAPGFRPLRRQWLAADGSTHRIVLERLPEGFKDVNFGY